VRLWTIHPRYLDAKGLVALWREALLAQKVLAGKTRGYTKHPQLARFRAHPQAPAVIGAYLRHIADEADRRGYNFDRDRIVTTEFRGHVTETRGQLLFEWEHLQRKLRVRAAELCRGFSDIECPKPHPIFRIRAGDVREWEKNISPAPARPASSRACSKTPSGQSRTR
jgi:hypothetical protein